VGEEKYTYLFIGIIVGIALLLFLGWAFRKPPTLSDCLRGCEEEGWNRTEDWIRECNNACLREYKKK